MASPNTGIVTQVLGTLGGHTTTGKFVEGEWPLYESYDKAELWTGGNANVFSFAGFFRVPAPLTNNNGTIIANGGVYFTLNSWWNVSASDNRFQLSIDQTSSPYKGGYTITAGKDVHGLVPGDWFALMFSLDYSTATPTVEVWVQKKGDSTAYDVNAAPLVESWDTGPVVFDFDTASAGTSIGSHPNYSSNGQDFEECEFFMTNEFVDWSNSAERAKFVDSNGYPVGLGADGSLLTGTAAKIYLPDGDGTNNAGTAGNFTEAGTISNSVTSPTDGAPAPGYASWLSQSAIGTYDPKDVTSTCSQILPFITQFLEDTLHGSITHSLWSVTQAGTATFEPGTSTGSITQTLSPITQAVSADFFAGTTIGVSAQSLQPISQSLTGTYAPGISTGGIVQTISGIVSAMNGTHQRGHYGQTTQLLSTIVQSGTATFAPGTSVGISAQSLWAISQTLTGHYEVGGSAGWITYQALPFITQALTGEVWEVGNIGQILPVITQTGTATFAPDTSTGAISQTIPFINQALAGSRLRTGVITSSIAFLTQSLDGNFTAGTSTGSMALTLPSIVQAATAHYEPGTSIGSIAQTLPILSQSLRAVTFIIIRPTARIVWEQPIEELIWEIKTDELIWQR